MRTSTTLHMLLIAGLLSVTACNDAQQDRAENIADSVAARVDNVVDNAKDAINGNADSNFVVDAAIDNMAEIKSIQAGLDRGTNKELKGHARMMMADHKKMGAEVKALSAKLGYTLPATDDGKGNDAVASIDKKNKGNDWDKAWVDHMVSAHEDAIRLFEKGQNNVRNGELKTMITNALPTLRSHLDMMKQMQDKLGK